MKKQNAEILPEVLWIYTAGELPVGIVKVWDEIEGSWKFYIGTGHGKDLNDDIQEIVDWGSKYYSLDFITQFGSLAPPGKN